MSRIKGTPSRRLTFLTAVAVAVTGVATATGAPAAAAAPSSPSAATPHCVVFGFTYSQTPRTTECYASLRTAIEVATTGGAGMITNGPTTSAGLTEGYRATVNAAGDAARAAGGNSRYIGAIAFSGKNYTGYSTIASLAVQLSGNGLSLDSCRGATTSIFARHVTGIQSIQSFNQCLVRNQFGGLKVHAFPDERLPDRDIPYSISPLNFVDAPTRDELLTRCDQHPDDCEFQVESELVQTPGEYEYQDRLANCSNSDSSLELSWNRTVGGSISMGLSVSVTATAGVPGAAAIESSVTAEFGTTWQWSGSRTKTVATTVRPNDWAQLVVSPLMQTVSGKYIVTFDQPVHGLTSWEIWDVEAERPHPSEAVHYTVIGDTMTPAEIEAYCSLGAVAARRAGTAPETPGMRFIDPPYGSEG
ncbi:hypothetical protein [Verrucosispora sp. WMMD1129]|uniref:hypothetical protein n=1 Tax=Verrucosispora sp. WMMD1129 TaxID=3016093 RepID=UPI00249C940F|nr:hypothetical protein [Verrucosispora sp. WMMD1129]WFE47715.1 hypothetical protein O7624_26980 [Verrucosispora sp. WMMD1129]